MSTFPFADRIKWGHKPPISQWPGFVPEGDPDYAGMNAMLARNDLRYLDFATASEAYWLGYQNDYRLDRDFTCLLPPAQFIWAEWQVPETVRIFGKLGAFGGYHRAALIEAKPSTFRNQSVVALRIQHLIGTRDQPEVLPAFTMLNLDRSGRWLKGQIWHAAPPEFLTDNVFQHWIGSEMNVIYIGLDLINQPMHERV